MHFLGHTQVYDTQIGKCQGDPCKECVQVLFAFISKEPGQVPTTQTVINFVLVVRVLVCNFKACNFKVFILIEGTPEM